jgi:hypothetical protein
MNISVFFFRFLLIEYGFNVWKQCRKALIGYLELKWLNYSLVLQNKQKVEPMML